LLLIRSVNATTAGLYAADGVLTSANGHTFDTGVEGVPLTLHPGFRGGTQTVLTKSAATKFGIFDGFATPSFNHLDPRLDLLKPEGRAIFLSYANLIDAVFAEGDTLENNPAQPVQVVSAIQPITAEGVIYDRVAQVAGVGPDLDGDGKGDPTFNTYLLEFTASESQVIKDGFGNARLSDPTTPTARRLLLSPEEATSSTSTNPYTALVDGVSFSISTTSTSVSVETSMSPFSTYTPVSVESVSPLVLNVPDQGNNFPDKRIVAKYRVTGPNGSSYLIGLSTEGKIYVTSLAAIPSRLKTVDTTASLSGLEYLLFYNEARIKILRAQLAYREAVVREIQTDLKQANAALAELETQSGAVTATNSEGEETNQFSAETLSMNLFNATNGTAGKPIFSQAGNDSYHLAKEWTPNRTTLKNYIDRRSSEAQEASLDYQNVLNRFNNALEVMAKLQEKLDTLLKAQLRNLA
jgi:hypothetical protein